MGTIIKGEHMILRRENQFSEFKRPTINYLQGHYFLFPKLPPFILTKIIYI